MAKLKRIGVLFLAKLQAMIMALVGLVTGILYAFGGFVVGAIGALLYNFMSRWIAGIELDFESK